VTDRKLRSCTARCNQQDYGTLEKDRKDKVLINPISQSGWAESYNLRTSDNMKVPSERNDENVD
jgi:hypothetical protein